MMVHEDPGAPQTALAAMFAPDVLPFLAPCAQALPAHREPQTPQHCQVPQTGPLFLLHPLCNPCSAERQHQDLTAPLIER